MARRSAASRLPGSSARILVQKRDGPRVLLADEEPRGLVDRVEEAGHVGRARRVLPHDGRRPGGDVAEARQLAPLLLPQRLRGGPAPGGGDGVLAQGRAQGPRHRRLLPEVPGLGRVGDHVVDLQPPGEDRLRPALDGHHLGLPAVGEEGLHRLPEDDLRPGAAEAVLIAERSPVEDRVEDAAGADRRVAHARRDAGADDDEGDVHRRLVDEVAVLGLAVVAEALPVIGREHHRDRPRRPLLEGRDEAPQLLIHGRHLAQVGRLRVAGTEGLRRLVGGVRVEIVHPGEPGLRGSPVEPGEGPVGRLPGAPLGPPGREVVVVVLEPPGEAEAARQNEARDEGGGVVPGGPEPLREKGVLRAEVAGVLVDTVPRREEAGEQGGVGGQRLGNRRVGLAETEAPRRERIEGRRLDPSRLGADRIGTRGVERDEQDRGAGGWGVGGRRRRRLRAGHRPPPRPPRRARRASDARGGGRSPENRSRGRGARAASAPRAAFVLVLATRALLQTVP